MTDTYSSYRDSLDSPASSATSITPGATEIPVVSRALYIGGSGDVTVTMQDGGNDITFAGVPAGTIIPIRVTHVLASTTATNIVALW